MKNVVLKVIASCAILCAVGYVASRVVKSRLSTQLRSMKKQKRDAFLMIEKQKMGHIL